MSGLIRIVRFTNDIVRRGMSCDAWGVIWDNISVGTECGIWCALLHGDIPEREVGDSLYLSENCGDQWVSVPDDYPIPDEVVVALARFRLTQTH